MNPVTAKANSSAGVKCTVSINVAMKALAKDAKNLSITKNYVVQW